MHYRMLSAAALTVLSLWGFCGCSRAGAVTAADRQISTAQTAASPASAQAPVQNPPAETGALLSREQAQAIALAHAGFTADQVSFLRTEYEIDDGVPKFEVQFRQGLREYDYEINAETGAILSYDRDD